MCPQTPQSNSSSPASCTTPDPTDIKSQVIVSPRALLNLALQAQEHSHPGALNLIPCTAHQYSKLCDSIEDKYELVEGLLLWREMPDRQHLDIQALLNYLLLTAVAEGKLKIVWYIEPIVNFVRPFEVTDAQASSSSSTENKDSRIADVAIGAYYDNETRHDFSPNSNKNPFSVKRLPRVVIEITSPSNYNNDVNDKWKQYAKYKIPEYYIIDRKRQCVVRGYFDTRGGYRSGDCEDNDRLNPKETGKTRYYYRDIFRGDEIIRGHYLGKLNITANEVLNPLHLPDRVKNVEKKRKETEEETKREMILYRNERDKAHKKIQEFEDVTRTLFKDLETEEKKRKAAEEKSKIDEKERKAEKKKRKAAEEKSKIDEKKRKTAEEKSKTDEKTIKASEARVKELEAQVAEFQKTIADPSIAKGALSELHKARKRSHSI